MPRIHFRNLPEALSRAGAQKSSVQNCFPPEIGSSYGTAEKRVTGKEYLLLGK